MRIISLPAAASKSTGMKRVSCGGAAVLGGSYAGGPSRFDPVVEQAVTSNSSNANRFISIFLSPREKAHEKTEVAAFARRMCERAIGRDLQSVLRRSRRHFVFAHEMRLHRFESIDDRAVQLERDHRRR